MRTDPIRPALIHPLICFARWLAIALALVMAQTIGGLVAHALMASMVSEAFLNIRVDWLAVFTTAGLEAAAAYCLLTGLRVARTHQVWILFVFYWGTKFLQMLIEAAFFLNVWQVEPIMSWSEVMFSLCYGTITSLLFAPLAVGLANVRPTEIQQPAVLLPSLRPTLKIGAAFVPIYFLAGTVLAVPLAGPAFGSTYEGLQLPAWLPLFQFVRGLLWAMILWLVVANHGSARDSRVTTAVALGIVSSIQLLQPNPYMEDQLRAAHLTEVWMSMTAFGWLAAWIFGRSQARTSSSSLTDAVERGA